MKYYISIFVYFLLSLGARGQQHSIDSLKKLLRTSKEDTNTVRTLQKISAFYDESAADSSIVYEQKALELSQKLNYKKGEIGAIIQLGFLAMTKGNYPMALQLLFEARKDKSVEAENPFSVDIYQNIGLVYYYMSDFGRAKEWLLKAKATADNLNLVNNYFIPLNLGRTYLKLNNLDSALEYIHDAYQINMRTKSMFGRSSILLSLGEINEKLSYDKTSLEHYQKAIEAAPNENGGRALIRSYQSLSNFYWGRNQPDSALAYAMKAESESRRAGYTQQLMESAAFLSKIYHARHQDDSAYFYLAISTASREEMYGQEKQSQVHKLIFSDILRDLEQTRREQEAELYRKQNLQYIIIAIALSAFAILFMLLSRSIIVNEKLIKFFGVIGLLMVFEFINLLIHPFLVKITNHSPFFLLFALVIVAAILIPVHHKIQSLVTKIVVEKNKQIRLAAAKKTIQELEGKLENI